MPSTAIAPAQGVCSLGTFAIHSAIADVAPFGTIARVRVVGATSITPLSAGTPWTILFLQNEQPWNIFRSTRARVSIPGMRQ
jgi:hypothetical protein